MLKQVATSQAYASRYPVEEHDGRHVFVGEVTQKASPVYIPATVTATGTTYATGAAITENPVINVAGAGLRLRAAAILPAPLR